MSPEKDFYESTRREAIALAAIEHIASTTETKEKLFNILCTSMGMTKDDFTLLDCHVLDDFFAEHQTVSTEFGEMTVEDYRNCKAQSFGYADYDDFAKSGCRLGDGYDDDRYEFKAVG